MRIKQSGTMRQLPWRVAAILMATAWCIGCHHGERGVLVIANETGKDLFCLWTIAPRDSVREMLVAPTEDSLKLGIVKDGDEISVALPPGYAATDRISIRLYSLDATGSPRRYRLESLTMTSVQHLEAVNWSPVVIKNVEASMNKR